MDQRRKRHFILFWLFVYVALSFCFMQSACARNVAHWSRERKHIRSLIRSNVLESFGIAMSVLKDTSNTQPYVSSPLSMTPYESLPPFPLPDNGPPGGLCVTPPFPPQPPSSSIPTPSGGFPPSPPLPPSSSTPTFPGDNPPSTPPETIPTTPPYPPSTVPTPPFIFPYPPTTVPSPPDYVPIAPPANVPSPPFYEPSPPSYTPSPTIPVPSPPVFVPSPLLPPVVFPPPAVPPPHHTAPAKALWCVAKPSVPEPITQEAMNYACASGADCDQIKPSGSCFHPDTVLAHASYAFNSYWQRSKAAGGTCEFGGSAILVTADPSYDGCHFLYF